MRTNAILSRRSTLWLAICLGGLLLAATPALAQKTGDSPAPPPNSDPAQADPAQADPAQADPAQADPAQAAEGKAVDASAALKQYEEDDSQWKAVLTDLRKLQAKYQTADDEESKQIESQWEELLAKARGLLAKLHVSGKEAYAASPNTNRELTRFLVKLLDDEINRDEYELAADLSQVLIENQCEDPRIYDGAGVAAFLLNDYDAAGKYLNQAKESGVLSSTGEGYLSNLDIYRQFWDEEKKLRAAEAEKDDLPRVKLTTTKGDIVVELFENEAPETVGNFVSLVSSGFYNDKLFHRVLKGFMAQGGCPIGDGSGGPGYKIYCESQKDNYRKHFRGTLSMAHAGLNTGGSQFFLTFVPTSHLNGVHTAFGRVIEGMDVLAKLQRTDGTPNAQGKLDKIVKAEVLRKRDHEYVPHKVE